MHNFLGVCAKTFGGESHDHTSAHRPGVRQFNRQKKNPANIFQKKLITPGGVRSLSADWFEPAQNQQVVEITRENAGVGWAGFGNSSQQAADNQALFDEGLENLGWMKKIHELGVESGTKSISQLPKEAPKFNVTTQQNRVRN